MCENQFATLHQLGHKPRMITRSHQKGDAASVAVYSDCEKYRYMLTRVWDRSARRVHFIMLNPSTATELQNDPTVERCERRARALGCGAFRVTNIFAWRDTDPRAMRRATDPIGPANNAAILESCDWADQIICAWGSHGDHRGRGQDMAVILKDTYPKLYHLGITKSGQPKHPLYIAYREQPTLWG